MPTADPSNVLFKIAHPDLYERNPFNLLNLPINATARDIRRRKEDIEAAFDAGTEAEEFRFVLPVDANRQSPTREAVNEAFEVLNEPDLRIAYALFWFWPDGGSKKTSNPNRDLAEWMASFDEDVEANVATSDITSQFLERHNLAVYKHLSAISMEDPIRRLNTILSQTQDLVFAQRKLADKQIEKIVKDVAAEYVAFNPRFRSVDILLDAVRKFLDACDIELDEAQVREYYSRRSTIDDRIKDDSCNAPDVLLQWNEAIELWNSVVSDADFWHSVSEMVSALNDPRLDYRFARSLRDQFAFAFDQINVELAIEFAKTGRESDAKRQVKYMKLSQPDADDVEGTFDDAFTGLLRQTDAICKTARAETDKNPNDGLHQANLILEQTDEPLRVSRVVLEKGTAIRNAIVTTIFSAVRNCLVAYGNKTTDWDGCLKLYGRLKAIAETPEQAAVVSEDEKIIRGNKDAKEEKEGCWICKKMPTSHNSGENTIGIPLHGHLEAAQNGNSVNYEKKAIHVPVCLSCQRKRAGSSINVFATFPECITHPWILSALNDGWRMGSELSHDEVEKCLERSFPIARQAPAESDQHRIHFFHEWCQQLEQVLTCIQSLPLEHRFTIAQVLFDRLGEVANNPADVYAVLQALKQSERKPVDDPFPLGIIIDGDGPRSIGTREEHLLFSSAYFLGYEFLSSLHYQNHPYHNPRHANRDLFNELKKDKVISSFFDIEFSPGSGYGGGSLMLRLRLSLERRILFGILSCFAVFLIEISLECIVPDDNGKRNFLEGIIQILRHEKVKKSFVSANDSPFIIANQIRNEFARLGLSSPRQFAAQNIDADIVVSHAASIVKKWAVLMIKAIDATQWKRISRIPENTFVDNDQYETIVFMK